LTDGHGGSGPKSRQFSWKRNTVKDTAKNKKLIELHCTEGGEGREEKRKKS
jgi:hypothetical protein